MLSRAKNSFTEEQKNWYFRLVITAILSDGEVNSAEVVYLTEVLTAVKSPGLKKELIGCIQEHKFPELGPTPEFDRPTQCAIFIEIVEILICDVHLATPEKDFIKDVAGYFSFPKTFERELIEWAFDGLAWYHSRSFLIHGKLSKSRPIEKIPIEDFNPDQKYRYALTLVSTVLLDHKIDPWEQRYVHQAIGLVVEENQKKELLAYLEKQEPPKVASLSTFGHECQSMILIEVLLMLSVGVSSLEQSSLDYFNELCTRADYNLEDAQKLLQWTQKGITWRENKERLIQG